jgi:hypothetical protein
LLATLSSSAFISVQRPTALAHQPIIPSDLRTNNRTITQPNQPANHHSTTKLGAIGSCVDVQSSDRGWLVAWWVCEFVGCWLGTCMECVCQCNGCQHTTHQPCNWESRLKQHIIYPNSNSQMTMTAWRAPCIGCHPCTCPTRTACLFVHVSVVWF